MIVNNALRRIARNKNINRPKAVLRYAYWQLIKPLNLFPRKLKISSSTLLIENRHSANEGGGLIYTHGLYDFNNMNLVLDYMRSENTLSFFDVGANKGVYSLLASEVGDGRIIAFEPHPLTFKMLSSQIALNNRTNVECRNLAIGSSNDPVRFTDVPGSSTNKVVDANSGDSNTIEIASQTLDHLCEEEGMVPDYLKVDVEGFEIEVVRGATKVLGQLKLVQIEISKHFDEVVKLLNESGLEGPYYYDYSKKVMSSDKFTGCEDPIFIQQDYLNKFKQDFGITTT